MKNHSVQIAAVISLFSIVTIGLVTKYYINQNYLLISVGTIEHHHPELISRAKEDAINKQMPTEVELYKKRFNLK